MDSAKKLQFNFSFINVIESYQWGVRCQCSYQGVSDLFMQHNSSFWGSNEHYLIQVLIRPDKLSLKLAMGLLIGAISLLVQHSLDLSPSLHVYFRLYYYNNNSKQQKYCFPSTAKCQMFLVLFWTIQCH